MKFLQKSGYKVIPVNPTCVNETIHGERVYGTLLDIKEKVDIVDVFRPSEETVDIAIKLKKLGHMFCGYNLILKMIRLKKLLQKIKFITLLINVLKLNFKNYLE